MENDANHLNRAMRDIGRRDGGEVAPPRRASDDQSVLDGDARLPAARKGEAGRPESDGPAQSAMWADDGSHYVDIPGIGLMYVGQGTGPGV